ncbi:MAG TPA: aminotransferase class I/II-fold pyridoxal phosphate-dependent enzyme [Oscillatoriaceae cyanobacterium]
MHLETLAVHAAQRPDPATGAIAPPISLSTTFERDPSGAYSRGFEYGRDANPNRAALEEAMALLEGGEVAAAFSSGMAAANAVFQALAPGDRVVAPNDAYMGVGKLLREVFRPWGLEVVFVDMDDLAQVRAALSTPTRLVWLETPSNPLLKVTDIAAVAALAKARGAAVACDNTWCTPVFQRPLDLGVDLVVHATTKYLGGHHDVLGGMVVAKAATPLFKRIRELQIQAGAVPSPFEAWLTLRGIRTLPVRMRAHADHAMAVAHFLDAHPAVEIVHYPGLSTHPGHEVAARQMRAFGGMLSFQVKGDRAEAMAVAARVQLFTRATSLGGVESLIEHRASVEGPTTKTPENLLRVSVGLEHADDLCADLDQALRGSFARIGP